MNMDEIPEDFRPVVAKLMALKPGESLEIFRKVDSLTVRHSYQAQQTVRLTAVVHVQERV